MPEIDKEFKKAFKELSKAEHDILNSEELEEKRGERSRKVDMQFVREIMYAIQSVSIGTQQVLYFAGLKYSKYFLNDIASDYSECVENMRDIFDKLDVGTLKDIGDGDQKKLAVEENVLCYEGPEVDKPLCYFISGWIAGFLKGNLGKDFIVNEVECSATGSERCEFVVRER